MAPFAATRDSLESRDWHPAPPFDHLTRPGPLASGGAAVGIRSTGGLALSWTGASTGDGGDGVRRGDSITRSSVTAALIAPRASEQARVSQTRRRAPGGAATRSEPSCHGSRIVDSTWSMHC